MKLIASIILINLIFICPMPVIAGSHGDSPAEQPSFWGKVWQDFKNDWTDIGKGAKQSGAEVGRSFKEEAKETPENFRKGWKEAQEDFKNGTPTPNETRSDH